MPLPQIELYTTEEVAKALKFDDKYMYELLKEARLKNWITGVKIGRSWRYEESEILRFIKIRKNLKNLPGSNK